MNLKIISAGAGSGKTFRLTQEMVRLLKAGVRASGIIATTFTKKAAAELQERVRTKLLEEGLTTQANDLSNALIGTVHSLGVKLLQRFAYEAGVSPAVEIIAEEDQQIMFNQSMAMVLSADRVEKMELLCDRLGLNKKGNYDWRKDVKKITEVARANGFHRRQLEESKQKSVESFLAYLPRVTEMSLDAYWQQFGNILDTTIHVLINNEDETKTTKNGISALKAMQRDLRLRGRLNWWELVKVYKLKVGAKSKDELFELKEFAAKHEQLDAFKLDISDYISLMFEMAAAAMEEFDRYKKQRGLIDFTDMEVFIRDLLDHPQVKEVLAEELDLLMVDEFQDTSPIQLELFLKLAQLAKFSVWVGDPKQSIYGFRGAEPELMLAIIAQNGGVKPEDIQEHSWRSREDVVFCTNTLFTKAFSNLPVEQVALKPRRTKLKSNPFFEGEPIEANEALMHWHFQFDGKGNTNRVWMNNAIADSIKQLLDSKIYICPKGSTQWRVAQPGDVAILCRSNKGCEEMASALHRAGLRAAIAQSGLLNTAEAKLVLACLKYILTRQDTLSVAEILLLATKIPIEEIIVDRLKYLRAKENGEATISWAADKPFIKELDALREDVKELSSSEILNLLLDELDLRRIIAAWGNVQQRLDNVDVIRKMATDYEERCNRLHTAASLGGFLLWLNEIENNKDDKQASGESMEAVRVMTYHKSKGLEFPILICHSMEDKLRADVWGMEIVSDRQEVDLADVLGGRWLRFWVNPYADQVKGTPLIERLEQSPIYKNRQIQARAEEARLLYVGITRARDYLVFVSRDKPMRWLNRVWHEGNEDYATLDPNSQESPWFWENRQLAIRSETFFFDKDFEDAPLEVQASQFIEPAQGKADHEVYKINLREEDWTQEFEVKSGITITYASPLQIDETEQYNLGKAFKALLIADWLHYPQTERLEMATQHQERYSLTEFIEADLLHQQSNTFHQTVKTKFQPQQQFRKYTIQLHWNGRLFDTVLDFLLITDRKVMLIQNSGFAGDPKRWRKHVADALGDWCFLVQAALEQLYPEKEVETWIHFVLGGSVLEVRTRKAVQNGST